jgi:hypothetical protein
MTIQSQFAGQLVWLGLTVLALFLGLGTIFVLSITVVQGWAGARPSAIA